MTYRDRSVDVFVRKVRRKLVTSAPGWTYVHTHFGVGYRFSPERVTALRGAAEGLERRLVDLPHGTATPSRHDRGGR